MPAPPEKKFADAAEPARGDAARDWSARPSIVGRSVHPVPPFPMRRVRCECRRCGVHTVTDVGFRVAGSCCNCGSFELVPVEEAR
jgi:hypothetical protein